MIAGTYVLSGAPLFVTAWMFGRGRLDAAATKGC